VKASGRLSFPNLLGHPDSCRNSRHRVPFRAQTIKTASGSSSRPAPPRLTPRYRSNKIFARAALCAPNARPPFASSCPSPLAMRRNAPPETNCRKQLTATSQPLSTPPQSNSRQSLPKQLPAPTLPRIRTESLPTLATHPKTLKATLPKQYNSRSPRDSQQRS
jgi:hypothetical protein